jgi:hypothetical protein
VLPKKINWLSKINNLAAQKNNVVAAQNYEFSCPNLRQPSQKTNTPRGTSINYVMIKGEGVSDFLRVSLKVIEIYTVFFTKRLSESPENLVT